MDTPEKTLSSGSIEQEHEPAANRFLNSLGFGETMLQDLRGSESEGEIPSSNDSEEEKNPAVMLSPQTDELTLPGAGDFSKTASTRRGGLQDIVKKQSKNSRIELSVEKIDENKTVGDEASSNEPAVEDSMVQETAPAEKLELKTESPEPEIEDSKVGIDGEIPFPDAVLKKSPSQIVSVIVNGREIKRPGSNQVEGKKSVIKEAEKKEESIISEISVLSEEEIEIGNENIAGEEELADNESSEPFILSCPKCDGELTLHPEHLGVEGNCVWCEAAIVAAESAADGKIRVFAIESEKAGTPEPEHQQEVVVSEDPKSEPLVTESRDKTSDFPPQEAPQLEIVSEDDPGVPLFEKERDVSPPTTVEEPQQAEDETPELSGFSSLPKAAEFADLPDESISSSIENEEKAGSSDRADSFGTPEEPAVSGWSEPTSPKIESAEPESKKNGGESIDLPELPSASTFDKLGMDAAWDEPFPETPQVDESELEKFPFLGEKIDSQASATASLEPESSSSFSDPGAPKKEEVTKSAQAETAEKAPESSLPSEPLGKAEAATNPFPEAESKPETDKLPDQTKLKIPDDVLNFLGNVESENEEPSETTETETENDEIIDEAETTPEPEPEEEVKEVAPLSKKELKKERRAKKKEDSQKKAGSQPGPLPAPGKVSSKKPGKTKVRLISIAAIAIGLGVASFLLPVDKYVEKARSLMSEAFNKQIGLNPDWKPSDSKEANPGT